jgi:hypothetical protein
LVGLRTQQKLESLDCWLNEYERSLEPFKNGIKLLAVFASRLKKVHNLYRIQEFFAARPIVRYQLAAANEHIGL